MHYPLMFNTGTLFIHANFRLVRDYMRPILLSNDLKVSCLPNTFLFSFGNA